MSENIKLTTEVDHTVPAALKWMYENELLSSSTLLSNLYGNIYAFPNVKDAEILIDRYNRKMLIYIEFVWLARVIFKSRKKDTTIGILDNLQELLPSFEFRIIEDKTLFDKALDRMQKQVLGDETPEAAETGEI